MSKGRAQRKAQVLTLRELRRSRYLTLPEAATAAGIDPSTLYKYERGSVLIPQVKTIRGIADAYNVHPREIEQSLEASIVLETKRTLGQAKRMNDPKRLSTLGAETP